MCSATRADARFTYRRWRGSCLIAAALLCLLALFVGCSTEKRYKVLSFFFDGVPNPHAPAASAQGELDSQQPGAAVRPIAYIHKPYGENKCNECHGTAS